jgi:hypothetical protein
VRRSTAYVQLDRDALTARFGWWRLTTPFSNVLAFQVTGPYRWWRAIGFRRSLRGGDVTFGTSTHGGVCLMFREPVSIWPFRAPALTVTVDDVDAVASTLRERGVPQRLDG